MHGVPEAALGDLHAAASVHSMQIALAPTTDPQHTAACESAERGSVVALSSAAHDRMVASASPTAAIVAPSSDADDDAETDVFQLLADTP